MPNEHSQICVIIAAYNAEATIGRAIASALAEPEVADVAVVIDASTDGTLEETRLAASNSPQVRIIEQSENTGPAAARNRGIEATSAPLIAILDADDYFLPGRFARLEHMAEWDAVADNIAFVPEAIAEVREIRPGNHGDEPRPLTVEHFIEDNIARPARPRGEISFMKPVMRREFLDRNRLRYDETMRLGEDYALYVRMLLAGARFGLTRSCGYVAIERAASLSGRHSTADLAALLKSDQTLLRSQTLSAGERAAISRHAAHIAARHHLRDILDVRRQSGRFKAAMAAAASPGKLPGLVAGVLRDKLGRAPFATGEVRYLFD